VTSAPGARGPRGPVGCRRQANGDSQREGTTLMSKLLSPCENCPWRKEASTDTIPNFRPAMMQNLLPACSGDGWSIMACHKSTTEANVICAGFALVIGFGSIGLRLAAARGAFDPAHYSVGGIELHQSFEKMMLANGVEPQP
jgi:hypothetical protein